MRRIYWGLVCIIVGAIIPITIMNLPRLTADEWYQALYLISLGLDVFGAILEVYDVLQRRTQATPRSLIVREAKVRSRAERYQSIVERLEGHLDALENATKSPNLLEKISPDMSPERAVSIGEEVEKSIPEK